MEEIGIGISGERGFLSSVERRVAERRAGDRRQTERREACVDYKFLLLGIACRRSGQDRRRGERRQGERRGGGAAYFRSNNKSWPFLADKLAPRFGPDEPCLK